ncbi:MAG: ubiquitin-small subunit ribosomal protein S27Ae [Methanothermococcus sp.]|jgi:small subunit ribosomal protein S27Ae|uniref:30S ribosomal protein S27ae n=1 Tax=Methanothermococcus TaxID=155862 RepID=UPI000379455C|nr:MULTISPECIES: 30S ribosomal protein S27ae [Methanothermococcus]MDK2790431.1 ubiquitin-small subunit ribosomal protein S27Ae [Methanothermococcus sp.]MDK2987775.1 ubiquitin-small subunit ribosomal protein S27Ae [Methanothermococcus sp.]
MAKTQKYQYYKVEGDKVERLKKTCPKCGPGVFMAEHLNRFACGKCGYTEWKKSEKVEEE